MRHLSGAASARPPGGPLRSSGPGHVTASAAQEGGYPPGEGGGGGAKSLHLHLVSLSVH